MIKRIINVYVLWSTAFFVLGSVCWAILGNFGEAFNDYLWVVIGVMVIKLRKIEGIWDLKWWY